MVKLERKGPLTDLRVHKAFPPKVFIPLQWGGGGMGRGRPLWLTFDPWRTLNPGVLQLGPATLIAPTHPSTECRLRWGTQQVRG